MAVKGLFKVFTSVKERRLMPVDALFRLDVGSTFENFTNHLQDFYPHYRNSIISSIKYSLGNI